MADLSVACIRPGTRPAACGARHLPDGTSAVTCVINSVHVLISCRACGRFTVDGVPHLKCQRCDNTGSVPGDTDSGCKDCPDCGGSGAREVTP